MIQDGERVYLTKDEAISALNPGKYIHTIMNPAGGIMMGADLSRQSIIKLFEDNDGKIEIGGDSCKSMKHALVVHRDNGPLFIESNMEVINKLDPIETANP